MCCSGERCGNVCRHEWIFNISCFTVYYFHYSVLQGIDSEEPLLQLDNYVFKGCYEDILGTAMVFQHDKGTSIFQMFALAFQHSH